MKSRNATVEIERKGTVEMKFIISREGHADVELETPFYLSGTTDDFAILRKILDHLSDDGNKFDPRFEEGHAFFTIEDADDARRVREDRERRRRQYILDEADRIRGQKP